MNADDFQSQLRALLQQRSAADSSSPPDFDSMWAEAQRRAAQVPGSPVRASLTSAALAWGAVAATVCLLAFVLLQPAPPEKTDVTLFCASQAVEDWLTFMNTPYFESLPSESLLTPLSLQPNHQPHPHP